MKTYIEIFISSLKEITFKKALFNLIFILIVTSPILLAIFQPTVRDFLDSNLYFLFGEKTYEKIRQDKIRVRPTNEVIHELDLLRASFDNTKRITNLDIGLHNSFAVIEDDILGYTLKKNIKADAFFLLPKNSKNFDPPVIYLNANQPYSEKVKDYLKSESLIHYTFSSNEQGYRNTLPKSKSLKEVVVIGDSVAFGLGVNDEDTFPSQLQNLIGNKARVTNAALSGYNFKNYRSVLDNILDSTPKSIILLICANDFETSSSKDKANEIKSFLKNITKHKGQIESITIIFHNYIYESMAHFFHPQKIEKIRSENPMLISVAKESLREINSYFINWDDIVIDYMKKQGSILSPFSLYVDHCHFSRKGNELLAKDIVKKVPIF